MQSVELSVDGSIIRCTGEVDLLIATDSPECVELIDIKSGRSHWTATKVKESFQLGCWYPWLIFRNYPGVNRVHVRVFMPREAGGTETDVVIIDRKIFFELEQRIVSAVRIWKQYSDAPSAEVPAWPAPAKCAICPAVTICNMAHQPIADQAKDPEKVLRHLVVLEAAADSCRDVLKEMVRDGGDLVYDAGTPDAIAFGTGKPKTARAPMCSVYTPEGTEPPPQVEKVVAKRTKKATVDTAAT